MIADHTRIVAFDLHPLSFGFVVFEGADRVLDWGVRSFRHGVNAVKIPREPKLAALIRQFAPDAIVVRRPVTPIQLREVNVLKNIARGERVPVKLVSMKVVRASFLESNRNKHQIATNIASRLPALAASLPPKRKPWQSEHYRMSIFDAAALALTYFHQSAPSKKTGNGMLPPASR